MCILFSSVFFTLNTSLSFPTGLAKAHTPGPPRPPSPTVGPHRARVPDPQAERHTAGQRRPPWGREAGQQHHHIAALREGRTPALPHTPGRYAATGELIDLHGIIFHHEMCSVSIVFLLFIVRFLFILNSLSYHLAGAL